VRAPVPGHILFAYGYNLFNEDMSRIGYSDPGALRAFELIDRLWNVDKTAVPIGLYPGTTMTDAFFDNKFAMWVTHNQIVAHLANYPNFKMGVAKMPQGPGTNLADGRGTYASSGFWCIAEATKHLELTKKFVLKLYDPTYQKEIAKAFGLVKNRNAYLLIAPNLFFFFMFLIAPFAWVLFLSFQKGGILGPKVFVGFANYLDLFQNKLLLKAILNTLKYTVTVIPIIIFFLFYQRGFIEGLT
jgi:hypothetical protein